MEKKRKLPARAAARADHASKKRTLTPPDLGSETPTSAVDPELFPVVKEHAPPLPKSVQPGKPLPTIEAVQPDDLPGSDYQSIQESGVLAESLARSRQKWISEGIFERYWTKPAKRKGIIEANPPKESMTKLGQVTVTVEPHVFEAIMYAVKDPRSQPQAATTAVTRPVIQYGPPNGTMPPPPTSAAPTPVSGPLAASPPPIAAQLLPQAEDSAPAQSTPMPAPASALASDTTSRSASTSTSALMPALTLASMPTHAQPLVPAQMPTTIPAPQPQLPVPIQQQPQLQALQPPASPPPHPLQRPPRPSPPTTPAAVSTAKLMSPHRGMESMLSPSPSTAQMAEDRPTAPPLISAPDVTQPVSYTPTVGTLVPPAPASALPAKSAAAPVPAASAARPPSNDAPTSATNARSAPDTDPIILSLAEKAGENPQLRDLMKKVAQGDATKSELERFQAIIDAITAESKRKGTPLGPSADRLVVDGKTVRYFADEVRAILDIVLSSNPKQTSADLRPPPGSDPLVVMLVKTALDDAKTQDMVRRIAGNKPMFSDTTDLKAVLDRLRSKLTKERERLPASGPAAGITRANGAPNANHFAVPVGVSQPSPEAAAHHQQPSQQALRSKGPPPPPPSKPDMSAIVFEFVGGNGDRYLFPRFSVLESVPLASGQQVIASFLIVLKGSAAEYPVADPALDYYQPVTVRLYTHSGRHLENLAKVVAPPDEVRRYMDDVMDRMTRAEYIILAMRLPRGGSTREDPVAGGERPSDSHREKEREREKGNDEEKDKDKATDKEREPHYSAAVTPKQPGAIQFFHTTPQVLWGGTKLTEPDMRGLTSRSKMVKILDEDEQYQNLISSVSQRETVEG